MNPLDGSQDWALNVNPEDATPIEMEQEPQQPEQPQQQTEQPTTEQPTSEQPNAGIIGETMINVMDFFDDKFNGNQTTNEESRATYLANKAKREEKRASNPISAIADEITATGANAGAGIVEGIGETTELVGCLLYTSPSPRDLSTPRMPSSA